MFETDPAVVCGSFDLFFCLGSIVKYHQGWLIQFPTDEHLRCFQFGLFWIKPLSTLLYKSFCGHMSSRLLGKHIKMELLSHRVRVCFVFLLKKKKKTTAGVFLKPRSLHPFTLPLTMCTYPIAPHPCQHLVSSVFLIKPNRSLYMALDIRKWEGLSITKHVQLALLCS